MAILAFQKPDKVIMVEANETYGKFEFRPLEPGYGITVGNSLRRILLSSLEGYAITSIKIEGVEHEFSTLAGIVQDVSEIILNLKQVRFKCNVEEAEDEKFTVTITGQNTHFGQSSPTIDNVWFSMGSSTINANNFWPDSDTSLSANFSIPIDATIGTWDVNVQTPIDGTLTLINGFTINSSDPPPEPPTLFFPDNESVIDDYTPTFDWNDPLYAYRYHLKSKNSRHPC